MILSRSQGRKQTRDIQEKEGGIVTNGGAEHAEDPISPLMVQHVDTILFKQKAESKKYQRDIKYKKRS